MPVQYSYTSNPLWAVRPVQTLSACTVQLYLYSPYRQYGLYRASVPVPGCSLPLPLPGAQYKQTYRPKPTLTFMIGASVTHTSFHYNSSGASLTKPASTSYTASTPHFPQRRHSDGLRNLRNSYSLLYAIKHVCFYCIHEV